MSLYGIAHTVRDRMGWLWNLIEGFNGWLFALRYGKKLKRFAFTTVPAEYVLVKMGNVPTEELVAFFNHQPEEAYTYFKPHGFDGKSLRRLQKNRAFLGYVLRDKSNGKIAGYCFNRCFFHGQGFRGRMVDMDYRGKGLGTAMNKMLNEVGFGIGLRLFETVSKDNVASYKSALSASNVKVLKVTRDRYLSPKTGCYVMLQVKQIKNHPIDSNCYVIFDKAFGVDCIIVDPGSEDNSLLYGFLKSESLNPQYFILTHEHFDHCWGVR